MEVENVWWVVMGGGQNTWLRGYGWAGLAFIGCHLLQLINKKEV